ncbi:T9SS type A sorting domain-containing protein [Lewinella sp. 4G2]|uniref:T9SS type A sorting domain-containing protein n=1 Tax=Lewinella sp. 4G2 TaxID=1803372 RepID=UPI0007B4E823|nr:T9SS type A sorting domain-containing protein [Lewinella sp. 4G2]OAV45293.1 hypothetical protein A3850_012665 [Lewinella sp. 4G2]
MLHRLFFLALVLGPLLTVSAQERVTIFPGSRINDVSDQPFGVNLNTLNDAQENRADGARLLAEGLSEGGMKFLRFPGGEKSDVYTWAAPPYNDPKTAGLSRISPLDFPAQSPSLWNYADSTWAQDNYDFDEFMADCQMLGAEPVIVVAFDGMYKPAFPSGTSLTYDQALTMAVEWVRYANITKGYGIKYWSLGNETFNETSYGGSDPGYTQYGIDAAAFAQEMKAVDPSIKIGINGENFSDFDLALKECAPYVDWLDVHTYPSFGFTTYDDYRNTELDATAVVDLAQAAIENVADADDRERLFIAMTEISAYGYSKELTGVTEPWDQGNNLGQALANFDLMAQLANDDRLEFSQFWSSRWINNDLPTSQPTDLLSKKNELTAGGLALSILNTETLDFMVRAQSTTTVRAFASVEAGSDQLRVFLLNKSTESSDVDLQLEGYQPTGSAQRQEFTGIDVTDVCPTYDLVDDLILNGPENTVTLAPNSITVLTFAGSIDVCGTNLVVNPGFEDSPSTIAPWELALTGAGNGGVTGDQKSSGLYSCYVNGNDAYLYQTVTGLTPSTDYVLSYSVYNFKNGGSNVFVGAKNFGGAEVSREIDDTGFVFVPGSLSFTTGPDATTVEIYLYNFDDLTFAWLDDVSLNCVQASLPTELLEFGGRRDGKTNLLAWKAIEDANLPAYVIETSADAQEWSDLAQIAAAGITGELRAYKYADATSESRYYRLRMTEYDGATTYSSPVHLAGVAEEGSGVYPNPAADFITLPGLQLGTAYRIVDARGQLVLSGTVTDAPISLRRLVPGIHFLKVTGGSTQKFLIR